MDENKVYIPLDDLVSLPLDTDITAIDCPECNQKINAESVGDIGPVRCYKAICYSCGIEFYIELELVSSSDGEGDASC